MTDARTVIVCDWLPPAFGAVGQYMAARAERLADAGGDVVLIGLGETSSATRVAKGEGRLATVRLARPTNPKHRLIQRAIWTLATNIRLFAAVAHWQRGARDCEIVVTGSPPFLSYLLIAANALIWRRHLIYRITDFYPETALAAGKLKWMTLLKPLFERLRRAATRIEVLGEDQRRRLEASGVAGNKLVLVRDTSPIASWTGVEPAMRPFASGDVVLLYSGNLGVAHETETFCKAYLRHIREGANRVRLWVNGTGAGVADISAFCHRHGLPLHMTAPVPLAELAGVLTAADAHLVLLKDAFWGFVLPSKIYGCIQSGKPVLYVGPQASDVYLLARRYAATLWHASPGSVISCQESLEALAAGDGLASRPAASIDFANA